MFKLIDAMLALLIVTILGVFTHWIIGMALGFYCMKRIYFPGSDKWVVSSEKQKALDELKKSEQERAHHQRFFQYGIHGSHLQDKD